MMTETDAMALCLAKAVSQKPSSFSSEHVKQASEVATKLLASQKINAQTFARIIGRLSNQSAIRQWLVGHGFLDSATDALSTALSELLAKKDDELSKLME